MKAKIQNLIPRIFRKTKLIVELRNSGLSLLSLERDSILGFKQIFLRETSHDLVRQEVSEFLRGQKPFVTVLVLPRSGIIQKELAVVAQSGISMKEALSEKLGQVLPYSPDEMAYGCALESQGDKMKGLLVAIPEKQLDPSLETLEKVGLHADEVVTEDQTLLWLFLAKGEKGSFLALDLNEERVLCLAVFNGRLSFSRAFSKDVLSENLTDMLQELSLALLQADGKPRKVILTGEWGQEVVSAIRAHFAVPLEKIRMGGELVGCSTPLYGAQHYGQYPLVSLLPRQKKIEKQLQERKRTWIETGIAFGCLVSVMFMAFSVHTMWEGHQLRKLEAKIEALAPIVSKVRKIKADLMMIQESQQSKEQILQLLQDLSFKIPSGIQLTEMRVDAGEFVFQGHSPTHGVLSETVRVLEGIEALQDVKLERTRLRKRLNQDYFEFEVMAKWKG